MNHSVGSSHLPILDIEKSAQNHNASIDDPLSPSEVKSPEEVDDELWEGDPANPRNYSLFKKWTAVAIVSLYSFILPVASCMMAPALPDIALKFNITDKTILALTLCVFILTFGFAPLILAPLSEIFGRKWVLHICNVFSLIFNLGCAFGPNTGSLLAFRVLAGFSGSGPVVISGGLIADVFSERDRATAMALWSFAPLTGQVVGPIAGGFVAQNLGVEWVFIIISILCGVVTLVGIALLHETYAPVIRMRIALRDGDNEKAIRVHPHSLQTGNVLAILWINLSRPVEMLFRSSICFMISLYQAYVYGIYYIMFSTFATFFSDTYHFNTGVGGLTYLGLGVGFVLAAFGAKVGNKIYIELANRNNGFVTPEMRMPTCIFGSFLVPIGLFWYGWTAAAKTHWILPIIGTGIFGLGMMNTFYAVSLYLIDSFAYGASAIAAASLFRCLLGFAFPLFGSQMYDKLGIGPGNSLLGGLGILLGIPFPIWLYFKGEALRAGNHLTVDSTKPKKL